MYSWVLLPTDKSDGTEQAVEHVIDYGTAYDAALHVLYVVESVLFHGSITEVAMQMDSRCSALGAIDTVITRVDATGISIVGEIHRRETLTFDDS